MWGFQTICWHGRHSEPVCRLALLLATSPFAFSSSDHGYYRGKWSSHRLPVLLCDGIFKANQCEVIWVENERWDIDTTEINTNERCTIVWMSPPKVHCNENNPYVHGVWRKCLWKVIRIKWSHENRIPMMVLVALWEQEDGWASTFALPF